MDANLVVNVAVVAALIFLAVSLTILVASVMPLLRQSEATLSSLARLSDTLDKEVPPTLAELRGVMDGVNQIRSITAQRVTDVGHKAEELTGNVTTLVGTAKKESSVASAGLFAGLKAYFLGGEEKAESKSIAMERKNVELKH
ncbi:MAG: hypothetical protein K2X27_19990 [Candidatus Obscuribacterales bacterium]|nr:hypothetical protein [Candidatus Obscuribacterales bacterium]